MKIIFQKFKRACPAKPQRSRGFLTVEMLVAVSIITAFTLGAMTVAQRSIHLSYSALHSSQAAFLLEEGAEAVYIARDNAWSNISSLNTASDYYPTFSGGTWTLSLNSSQVGIFTRKVNVADVKRDNSSQDISTSGTVDVGTKLITVTVSWTEGGQAKSKILSFYLSDIFS